ncbi:hypothetical protein HOY34_01545 [Xinfangfangia sp. D13-10-4-6]|uniref:hypothetical protein n=1 Tax=Pseudogemmobacter hezensis TaxID=2737662 RepID=UPI001557FC69|nr:hypothetical protein [Pseudogemmobacter hezensis]NPD13882.1 hypothetical protein [Pseudogemmobacter hezensis]
MRRLVPILLLVLAGILVGIFGPRAQAAGAEPASFAPVSNPALGMGLLGGRDWSPEQPFLDVMKSARDWIGHRPGQWGGMDHDALAAQGVLDAQGWPTRLPEGLEAIGTVLLTDMPAEARDLAGRYLVTWTGQGQVSVGGLARNPRATGPGALVFDFTPGPGLVDLRITATDPADPIRNIRVVREDRAALLAGGEIFNPDFLARLQGVRLLRFMDWLQTNDSPLVTSADRPRPEDYTWTRRGVPIEIVVALANQLQADPWITVPHMADDALVRDWAQVVARDLSPGRTAWVEYSNEVWNWQFGQARWADQQAQALWGTEGAWLAFYALRASEVMAIWSEELKADRLVRVLSTQTGWLGLEDAILTPSLILDEGWPAPVDSFDAWAISGYFSGALGHEDRLPMVKSWIAESKQAARDHAAGLGLKGPALEAWADKYGLDQAIALAVQELRDGSVSGKPDDTLAHQITTVWPYHAEIAKKHGLRLAIYEGGTHVTGIGPVADDAEVTAFFTALNYSEGMGVLYQEMLTAWAGVSGEAFTHYGYVATPGRHGAWGGLRHLSDDNPRWQALIRGCATC